MSHPVPDTAELVRRAGSGDGEALRVLFDRHRQPLLRMIRARLDPRVQGRVDPSDVIQETLMVASQKLPNYVVDGPLPFYPWLRQIAWDKLVDLHHRHLRAAKRTAAREEPPPVYLSDASAFDLARRLVGPSSTPSAAAMRGELKQRVRLALDALSDSDRELLLLRYLEQLPSRDVAAIMNVSEAAVNMRHMRALERLRKQLNDLENNR